MTEEKRRYISYLLRLWQVSTEGKLIWRASLESPKTGERVGFTTLADLLAFLIDKTGAIFPDEEHQLDGTKKGKND